MVTEDGTSEYYYPEAVAGKTGYTSLAGQTLVTYAVKDDRRQVAVTLKSTQKTHYSDTKTILDFGFKRFKNVNVAENETHYITGEEPVEINGVSYLPSELYLDDTAVITLPNDAEFGDADQYLQTEIPENHPEGAVGRIIYSYNDRQIGVAWLYTTKALSSAAEPSQEAPEQTDPSSSKEPSEKKGISLPDGRLIAGAGAAVLLLIAVCGIYAAVQQRKEKERLARMKERRRKRLEEMGCSQDEFERLLNERKAALGKRTANDEPGGSVMSYFPFFTDIEGWLCVTVGGGKVAYRKVCGLLPFGVLVHAVAKEFIPEFDRLEQEEVRFRRSMRPFCLEDLKKADLVIAATNDIELNRIISRWCKQRKIPVNSVQGPEDSSFLFPSLFTDGPVTAAVCTGGESPVLAHLLKERISHSIPDHMGERAGLLGALRREMKDRFPDSGGLRRELSVRLAEAVFNMDKLPSSEEIQALLAECSQTMYIKKEEENT